MPALDPTVGTGGTDILVRPLRAGGIGLVGLAAALTVFVLGLALTVPPLDAAIVAVLYGLSLVAVFTVIATASLVSKLIHRLQ